MNRKCIKLAKTNNYKDLCIRHTFVKRELISGAEGACLFWHMVLLYAANTNIDYFPTNFVVHKEEIYYVDFECNDYMEEWNFENWGVKYWSKTPEFLQYVKEHS